AAFRLTSGPMPAGSPVAMAMVGFMRPSGDPLRNGEAYQASPADGILYHAASRRVPRRPFRRGVP
ncbi:MAG: hypothetical protein ACREF4_14475, partial [Gammaproteobacteria bacterium]